MADISLLRPQIWKDNPKITAAVTTANEDIITGGTIDGLNMSVRLEGNADRVMRYRKMVMQGLGLQDAGLATGVQVHSSNIAIVEQPGEYADTDGLITKEKNLCLGILVADCAAILISDEKNGVIAALHAGWRGAVSNIVPDAIEVMISLGANPQSMKAYVSPCLSLKNFEVGEEVAEQFPEDCVDRESFSKPHVDLKKFIRSQMENDGILPESITIDDRCTISDTSLYSYRRQKQNSGRMMALICQK